MLKLFLKNPKLAARPSVTSADARWPPQCGSYAENLVESFWLHASLSNFLVAPLTMYPDLPLIDPWPEPVTLP